MRGGRYISLVATTSLDRGHEPNCPGQSFVLPKCF